jgi:hypothetical protein
MKDELIVVVKVASKARTMVALKAVRRFVLMEFLKVDQTVVLIVVLKAEMMVK